MPEGISAFVMTPIAYWRNKKKVWDFKIRRFVYRHLPAGCTEASSGFFISSSTPSHELHEQLVQRGFVYSESFDAMINPPRER